MTYPAVIQTKHGLMKIHHPSDLISQHLIRTGAYEWYVVQILDCLMSVYDDGIMLDIGANMAAMSLPLASKYKNYQFHLFEVQSHMADIIEENIALNKLSNMTLHRYGLSDASGTIKIKVPDYINSTNHGAFSLDPFVLEHSDIAKGHGDTVDIEVTSLDSIDVGNNIRCIKLDVEGFEQRVLEGATKTLTENNYPPIVYELWGYNSWWRENSDKLKQYLYDLGYTNIHRIDDTGIAIHNTTAQAYEKFFS